MRLPTKQRSGCRGGTDRGRWARLAVAALVVAVLPAAGLAAGDSPETKPDSRTFDVRGVSLHYLEAGKGEPVVLIHGLHASAATNWQLPGVVRELAPRYRVLALDLPGHGRSSKPNDASAYGEQMVADVVALLDHLSIEKAHVVGYSLGGMIAAKLVVKHPGRVRSVVLGGMGWFREGSAMQRIWERLPARSQRTPSELVHSIGALAITRAELEAIAAPVEVIVGSRDPVKRSTVTPLREVRKDWPVIEIEGAGHLDCVREPRFRTEITAWLAKHAT